MKTGEYNSKCCNLLSVSTNIVLPSVSKVLERLVYNQFDVYLQSNSIINKSQSGFRAHHTAQDLLVGMVDDWRKALDRDELVGRIMLDFSKVFDSINHDILVDKMSVYGIKSGELKWFRNYLSHKIQ